MEHLLFKELKIAVRRLRSFSRPSLKVEHLLFKELKIAVRRLRSFSRPSLKDARLHAGNELAGKQERGREGEGERGRGGEGGVLSSSR